MRDIEKIYYRDILEYLGVMLGIFWGHINIGDFVGEDSFWGGIGDSFWGHRHILRISFGISFRIY